MTCSAARIRRRTLLELVLTLAISVISAGTQVRADDIAPSGKISGRVIFEGDIPQQPFLIPRGRAVVDQKVCAADRDIPDESLIIDRKTRGVANVFVWMLRKPKGHKPEPPPLLSKDDEPAFVGCRIVPHAQIFRTGQTIRFYGEDVVHNPHAFSILNKHP